MYMFCTTNATLFMHHISKYEIYVYIMYSIKNMNPFAIPAP